MSFVSIRRNGEHSGFCSGLIWPSKYFPQIHHSYLYLWENLTWVGNTINLRSFTMKNHCFIMKETLWSTTADLYSWIKNRSGRYEEPNTGTENIWAGMEKSIASFIPPFNFQAWIWSLGHLGETTGNVFSVWGTWEQLSWLYLSLPAH